MTFVARAIRLAIGLAGLGCAVLAVLALFGFASPALDLINHLQLPLFGGTLFAAAIAILAFPRGALRRLTVLASTAGFVASSITVVPEMLGGLTPLSPPPTDGQRVVRLMTHNLFGRNYEMELVTAVIAREDPDIIALQEYFGGQASELHPMISGRYPYYARCKGGKRANIGVYAKFPFTETMSAGACPEDAYGSQRTAHITAAFTLEDGQQFTVVTTHLDWPVPIERQRAELTELTEVIADIDGPLIVVGDFNSTPWSYTLRQFEDGAGLTRHTRNLVTFPAIWYYLGDWRATLPILPLDHAMSKGELAVHSVRVGERTGSDHLPIIVEFSLPRTGGVSP
jgi:endonuclease/exonuclease/phosphatase (EEP) superfamily protein YafD